MAFTSFDNIIAEISSGNTFRADWAYRVANTATTATGIAASVNLSSSPGQFVANAFPGTALTWVTCNEATGNGTQIFGIPHGGDVSPDVKHIMNASAIMPPANALVGGVLTLIDLQGYWPGISYNTTTTQTFAGTPSLRYTNGEGCRAFIVCTAVAGATVQNLNLSYKNTSGNTTATGNLLMRASSTVGQVSSSQPHTTSASSIYLPLAGGETGVSDAVSITMSATNTGTGALCIGKPLITIPLTTSASYITEREFLFSTPTLPRVYDGACLVWLYTTTAAANALVAAAPVNGHLEFGWG